VVAIDLLSLEPAVEAEWKVLVEKEPQET